MISLEGVFFRQARLLLQVLPVIARDRRFALKGGTAINLFLRDMPRLSVDIDLTYLPLEPRVEALRSMVEGLNEMTSRITRLFPTLRVTTLGAGGEAGPGKLAIRGDGVQILVEPNTVLRGSVFPPIERELSPSAVRLFEMSATVQTLSVADLYGGKLCAALDRQHPRDFFDLMILLEHESLTEEIRKAFLVYLVSGVRPMNELLDPRYVDIHSVFERQFQGMSDREVTYQELEEARRRIVALIRSSLTSSERDFLLSIKEGEPRWHSLGIPGVEALPAIQWKLENIRRMDPKKHAQALDKLRRVLELS